MEARQRGVVKAAADASGKEQSGVLEADSARLARQLLRGRGLIPLTVEPVSHQASGRGRGGLSIGRRLGQTELAVITRQLASLLGAQLPVADALTVTFSEISDDVRKAFERRKGEPDAAAAGEQPPAYGTPPAAGPQDRQDPASNT